MDGLEHGPDPFLEVLLRPLYRLAVNPSSGVFGNLLQILQHPLTRDVMRQRGEAKICFTPSFHCYLLKFRCHGRLIFSLHRRPFSRCMEPMLPKSNSTTADRFPMWPALPTSEYYQSV